MKQKTATSKQASDAGGQSQPTVFEFMMDLQTDLRAEMGFEPLPHWKRKQQPPEWAKNIFGNFRRTIFKSVLKLKPRRKVDWRNYGRCVGISDRYKTFLASDVPQILRRERLDRLSKRKQEKLSHLLGEEKARRYYLKILKLPANDQTPAAELFEAVHQRQMEDLARQREIALIHVAKQPAKTTGLFLKGIAEGYRNSR